MKTFSAFVGKYVLSIWVAAVDGFIIHELSCFSVVQLMGFGQNHPGIDFAVVFGQCFRMVADNLISQYD